MSAHWMDGVNGVNKSQSPVAIWRYDESGGGIVFRQFKCVHRSSFWLGEQGKAAAGHGIGLDIALFWTFVQRGSIVSYKILLEQRLRVYTPTSRRLEISVC